MKIDQVEGAPPGVSLITFEPHTDNRGSFTEIFHSHKLRAGGIKKGVVPQWNLSRSSRGTIRGMHFQEPRQAKYVWVIGGSILDVMVCINPASKHFGKPFSVQLRAEEDKMLYVPESFAHGFQALGDGTEVLYGVTALYNPGGQRGFRWNDPLVADLWPIEQPVVSPRDTSLPSFQDALNIKLRPARLPASVP